MGHTPTLMDYSRFNYVAQPEDKIDAADLIPKIGPYDKWATMWGYKPIPGAKTPEDEKKTLDEWAREQDDDAVAALLDRRLARRRSGRADRSGRRRATRCASTTLGLKNLERVAEMLLPATTHEAGRAVRRARGGLRPHARPVGAEMNHVVRDRRRLQLAAEAHRPDGRALHADRRASRQAGAVKFLNENAFETPAWAINPEILRRIEPVGVLDRIRTASSACSTRC